MRKYIMLKLIHRYDCVVIAFMV